MTARGPARIPTGSSRSSHTTRRPGGAASAFARLKALREQQARQEAAAERPESEKPQAQA